MPQITFSVSRWVAIGLFVFLAGCETTSGPEGTAPGDGPVVENRDVGQGVGGPGAFQGHALDDPGSYLSRRIIYFDFNQSTVLPEYQPVVDAHGQYIAQNPSARVRLEGHADERGTREYNLGLGERRGNAVSGLMSAQGGRGSQLTNVSYGEERPTCRVSDEECWGMNRRVEIVYTAK